MTMALHPTAVDRPVAPALARSLASVARRAAREERALVLAGAIHLALVPVFFALDAFDARTLLGVDVWLKPLKFASSIGVFCLTVALLLMPLTESRARGFVRWGTIVPLALEMVVIGGQAARGVASHFNDATPFDVALYALMGVAILVATAALATLLVLHVRSRALAAPLAWGVRAGIALALLGAMVGGVMSAHGGHTVGAEDGGEGMPLTGWSVEHGDLRVAHFVGLHALQALPLAGLVAHRTLRPARARRVVIAMATGYSVGLVALFALAVRGLPVVG